MCRERPISQYAYFPQESYLRDQGYMAHWHTIEELRPFSGIKIKGYCGAISDKVQGLQTTRRCDVQAVPVSCNPVGFIKPSLMSNGALCKEIRGPKTACLSPHKRKRQVTAFGPKHAEHARRFYKSIRGNPEFPQGALQHGTKVSPMQVSSYYRTKVSPMQVSDYCQRRVEKGHDLPKDPSFNSVNLTSASSGYAKSKIYVPIKSQPQETVLKVTRISPRPAKMQVQIPKASIGFGDKLPTILKKSSDFHEARLEMELKDAPIFQMLCEIEELNR